MRSGAQRREINGWWWSRTYWGYNKAMEVTFDPAKDVTNQDKHGVALAKAVELEWDSMLTWPDLRRDYGELRQCGIG